MDRTATRDLWMELVSPHALIAFMDYRDESVRTLAAKTRNAAGKPLSPAMIGHLRSGKRRTCTFDTAKAIEKALQAPPGVLFTPKSSRQVAA